MRVDLDKLEKVAQLVQEHRVIGSLRGGPSLPIAERKPRAPTEMTAESAMKVGSVVGLPVRNLAYRREIVNASIKTVVRFGNLVRCAKCFDPPRR